MSSSGAELLLPAGRFAPHRREQPGAILGTSFTNSACAIACRSMVYRWLRIQILCSQPDFHLIELSYPADRSAYSGPSRAGSSDPRARVRLQWRILERCKDHTVDVQRCLAGRTTGKAASHRKRCCREGKGAIAIRPSARCTRQYFERHLDVPAPSHRGGERAAPGCRGRLGSNVRIERAVHYSDRSHRRWGRGDYVQQAADNRARAQRRTREKRRT